jgi:archaellum component FlaC
MWSAKVDIKQRNVNNIKNKINSLDTKIMNINYCKTDLNRYKNMFKDTWLEIFKNHYPDINPDELDNSIEKIKEEKKKLEDDLLIAESHLEFAKKKLKSVESYKLN